MSNNGVKTKRHRVNRDKREQEKQEQEGRVILRYTEELRRELNLRLVTEQETEAADPWQKYLAPEKVLYVDSITVTDIRYPDK